MRFLLGSGVDINSGDYDGRTPLHVAVSNSQEGLLLNKYSFIGIEIVKYLLVHGAQTTKKDRYGNTPIDDLNREKTKVFICIMTSIVV